jgi:hypothetical protein
MNISQPKRICRSNGADTIPLEMIRLWCYDRLSYRYIPTISIQSMGISEKIVCGSDHFATIVCELTGSTSTQDKVQSQDILNQMK